MQVAEWSNYTLGAPLHGRGDGRAVHSGPLDAGNRHACELPGESHHLPVHGREASSQLPAALPGRGRDPRSRGRPLRQLPLYRHIRRRYRPRTRGQAPHHHLRAVSAARRDASQSAPQIPFLCVDAVCEVPFGSYPGNMPGEYFSDEEHMRSWMDAEKDPAAFAQFLKDHIYGVRDFTEYLKQCGGLKRLQAAPPA